MIRHDETLRKRLDHPSLGLGLGVNFGAGKAGAPFKYLPVTTQSGAEFVTTNGGADRVQVRIPL